MPEIVSGTECRAGMESKDPGEKRLREEKRAVTKTSEISWDERTDRGILKRSGIYCNIIV